MTFWSTGCPLLLSASEQRNNNFLRSFDHRPSRLYFYPSHQGDSYHCGRKWLPCCCCGKALTHVWPFPDPCNTSRWPREECITDQIFCLSWCTAPLGRNKYLMTSLRQNWMSRSSNSFSSGNTIGSSLHELEPQGELIEGWPEALMATKQESMRRKEGK